MAIEPVEKIVAPMYRSRDTLPEWFSSFEEVSSDMRFLSKLRPILPKGESTKKFDPKNVDNAKTVRRSLLMGSADVSSAAMTAILPDDQCHLLSSTEPVMTVPESVISTVPLTDTEIALQHHPADVITSSNVNQGEVLIITADQLQQLGLDGSVMQLVTTTSNYSHLDTSVPHYNDSEMPHFDSIPAGSHELPASVVVNQPAMTAVATTIPNLIGHAFASAVGISVAELSSFGDVEPDSNEWHLAPSTSTQVTAAVAREVICGTAGQNIKVKVSEQSVAASVPSVGLTFANSVACEENASCDVDMSALDITMFNSASMLSPAMPSQPCDYHMNGDSTLVTPKKMVCNHDDEMARPLPVAGPKIQSSDDGRVSPCSTGSATVTDDQCPVSSKDSEVGIFSVSPTFTGRVEPKVFSGKVSSDAVVSVVSVSSSVSFINSVPMPSPVHGMALISSSPHQMSAVSDIMPASVICSVNSSLPVPAGPATMSVPSYSLHQKKQIPMPHVRSPSKSVLSTQRPILPRSEPEPSFSPSKFLCSLPSKTTKRKKRAAKVDAEALPAIAPKTIVARSYLSPVKQVAASITARAKRLQNSPSRGILYTTVKLKTVKSPSSCLRPATGVSVNSPDGWTPANDEDEEEVASGGDGEEQSTDVDSQLEDEVEEELLAVSVEQSPSSYVQLLIACE